LQAGILSAACLAKTPLAKQVFNLQLITPRPSGQAGTCSAAHLAEILSWPSTQFNQVSFSISNLGKTDFTTKIENA
jgi:hypothetical protein